VICFVVRRTEVDSSDAKNRRLKVGSAGCFKSLMMYS
jgi:hypothetical protein